jgi:glycosyltransferase involved in cell wall biosynthesis
VINLFQAYAALADAPRLTIFVPSGSDLGDQFDHRHIDLITTEPQSRWQRLFSAGGTWERRVAAVGADLLQVENMPVPRRSAVPVVLSLHDLRAFDLWTDLLTTSGLYVRFLARRGVQRAARILTLSDYGSTIVSRRLRVPLDRITKVPAAADVPPSSAALEVTPHRFRQQYGITGPFVVCLGHLERRKNLRVVVQAIRQLNDRAAEPVGLVFVGQDHGEGAKLRAMGDRAPGVPLWFLGRVSDEDRWAALGAALCLAIPSLVEGFGLAALEAMEAGCPVIASTAAALPEVVGGAGILVGPKDVDGWSTAIGAVVAEPGRRELLVERGYERAAQFTWTAAAETLRDVHIDLIRASASRRS